MHSLVVIDCSIGLQLDYLLYEKKSCDDGLEDMEHLMELTTCNNCVTTKYDNDVTDYTLSSSISTEADSFLEVCMK
jgi:hypothetical protein